MTEDTMRIMVSRHSAFYSPLLSPIPAGFLSEEGFESDYKAPVLGIDLQELIRQISHQYLVGLYFPPTTYRIMAHHQSPCQ